MSTNPIVSSISQLFTAWSGEPATLVLPLARTASNRQYFRLKGEEHQAIGCYGPDVKENRAFISFSQHFRSKGLAVPEIYKVDLEQKIYLQEDLGATTLYSFLLQKGKSFSPDLTDMYRQVLAQLARIQIEGGQGLNYEDCYPRAAFDKQSMLWDLNTFKYYFLKLGGIAFDEQALEEDFHRFIDYLLTADCSYFMFRDFQSRNIMLKNGQPYFIDYQGGRKGALQYDLASLLFQPQAGIPFEVREQLLHHYLDTVETMIDLDRA
ncbi:MAG: phosphotransferase, partial [Bacteroidota bacterium]